jgi:hypothetical protein
MKQIRISTSVFIVLAVMFILASCSYVYTETRHYLGVGSYPPADPSRIEILRSDPQRHHERLGEVILEPQGNPSLVEMEGKMRQGAAKLGADAVVIVADETRLMGSYLAGPWWGREVYAQYGRVIVGVAIKYTP